jgi:hypothetical protein
MMPDEADLKTDEYEPEPYEDGHTESYEGDYDEHETTS